MGFGLLLLRVVLGLTLAAHGAQKLFGWFGGYGLDGTGGFLESIGFKPGRRNAFMAGATEAGGGLLLAGMHHFHRYLLVRVVKRVSSGFIC